MIGKQVCKLQDLLSKDSSLKKYILMGVFEKLNLAGDVTDIQDDFNYRINPNINTIIIRSLDDGRLSIQLAYHDKTPKDAGNGKEITTMTTKQTFVIDYFKPLMPVYNSEY